MIPVLHGVWAAAGASALITDAYEHIETQTVGAGGATSVTFSSIPGTYKHLQVRALVRSGRTTTNDDMYVGFNSDTGSNYAYHYLYGDGSGAGSSGAATQTKTYAGRNSVPGASSTANVFGGLVIDVLDYTSTSKNKTVRTLSGVDQNNTTGYVTLISGLWFATPVAVTSIAFTLPSSASFVQYSSFSLYGVK